MSSPVYLVSPGDPCLTLEQVREWQAYLEMATAGSGLRFVVLPPGSEVTEAAADGDGVTLMFPAEGSDLDACAE